MILDVVYNHSAEGNHLGPTLSFKGFDNPIYYRLVEDDPGFYFDYTGTGNTLNMRSPHTLQLVMDSLRWWATEMHVDGFRFDLASTVARSLHQVDRLSAFFDVVEQDPVISQVKLIAEPWDVGEGGYQVGNFRRSGRSGTGATATMSGTRAGAEAGIGVLAQRLTGSSDLDESDARQPHASINFVIAHDGFTVADLTAYDERHNEANGEDNNDGEAHNRSWNGGIEGPTEDPAVLTLRAQRRRAMLVTLLLSQGVPMLLGGDEMGRTQQGNNNAYCQDNEISWYDWAQRDEDLLAFTGQVISYRRAHPAVPAPTLLPGQADPEPGRRPRHRRHRLVRARRPAGGRRPVDRIGPPHPGHVPQRRPGGTRPTRPAGHRRPPSGRAQRRHRISRRHPPRKGVRASMVDRHRHRGRRHRPGDDRAQGRGGAGGAGPMRPRPSRGARDDQS